VDATVVIDLLYFDVHFSGAGVQLTIIRLIGISLKTRGGT
jgi:hypothetical protein